MEPYLAEIRMFGGNFAPRSWALCDGQILAIAQNQALFSLLGTTYGGDGRTTFALPDLRGRVPIGPGTGPGLSTRNLGQKVGDYQNVLNTNQMASHNHAMVVEVNTGAGGESDPQTFLSAANIYAEEATANAHLGGVVQSNTGASTPVDNMAPYTGINYIICIQGLFPSRS